ncbi:hypothetical protein D4764_10G0006270 [Takifugu flavidus]|uniref:Uncharacterized protein n=1 Tax=Takifugu flavidus TaxID=433684 RepID=A0A5C6PMG7_9TELE|nr:hypothetical protein D4764_10G0006270 [Takifugu flavidus]
MELSSMESYYSSKGECLLFRQLIQ